jgi:hypothetical protein
MSLVVRKIDLAKWNQTRILDGEQPSADAITNCMRTTSNALSVWSIRDENELEEAVLAMAAQFEHIDAFDVLSIETSLMEERGLTLVHTQGRTPYAEFSNKHLDVTGLDYLSLGKMAAVIIESIRRNRNTRITTSRIKRILADAVLSGKVQSSELQPCVQAKILSIQNSYDTTSQA